MARRALRRAGEGVVPKAEQAQLSGPPGRRPPAGGPLEGAATPRWRLEPITERVAINGRGVLYCRRDYLHHSWEVCYTCPRKVRFGGEFGTGAWVECLNA